METENPVFRQFLSPFSVYPVFSANLLKLFLQVDKMKTYKRETYNEVLERLIGESRN